MTAKCPWALQLTGPEDAPAPSSYTERGSADISPSWAVRIDIASELSMATERMLVWTSLTDSLCRLRGDSRSGVFRRGRRSRRARRRYCERLAWTLRDFA